MPPMQRWASIVNYVIDASSIINLRNVGALGTVCRLTRAEIWISPIVFGECEVSCAAEIMALHARGAIHLIDEALIPSETFLDLLAEHGLGAGETESIAVSKELGHSLCCDDKQARQLGASVLGKSRVVGSLRLLQFCVVEALLSCTDAFSQFSGMKAAGGFLPSLPESFFCAPDGSC